MTHSDLASLSAAHERNPQDESVTGRYHQALCRIFGHLVCGLSVQRITENGEVGSYCHGRRGGCPVCNRCNQVTCEHANLWEPRKLGTSTVWTRPGEGEFVDEEEEEWTC